MSRILFASIVRIINNMFEILEMVLSRQSWSVAYLNHPRTSLSTCSDNMKNDATCQVSMGFPLHFVGCWTAVVTNLWKSQFRRFVNETKQGQRRPNIGPKNLKTFASELNPNLTSLKCVSTVTFVTVQPNATLSGNNQTARQSKQPILPIKLDHLRGNQMTTDAHGESKHLQSTSSGSSHLWQHQQRGACLKQTFFVVLANVELDARPDPAKCCSDEQLWL